MWERFWDRVNAWLDDIDPVFLAVAETLGLTALLVAIMAIPQLETEFGWRLMIDALCLFGGACLVLAWERAR